MPSIRTILHPTDFSENSRYAFQTACSLARDHDARLVLLHVMVPASAPLIDAPATDSSRSTESQEALKGRFPWPLPLDSDIVVEHRAAEGDPIEEILRMAKSLQCDMIVMGTHGRTGLRRLLTGSVAEEVLRRASCPVLAVRPPFPEST
jgi:nucleotide-binding universal stress UspA family protein